MLSLGLLFCSVLSLFHFWSPILFFLCLGLNDPRVCCFLVVDEGGLNLLTRFLLKVRSMERKHMPDKSL